MITDAQAIVVARRVGLPIVRMREGHAVRPEIIQVDFTNMERPVVSRWSPPRIGETER